MDVICVEPDERREEVGNLHLKIMSLSSSASDRRIFH